MAEIRKDLTLGPNPVDISVYQGESTISWWPFGKDLTVPADFADYNWIMDVFDQSDPSTPILTSDGVGADIDTSRDDVEGKFTFTIPHALGITIDWTTKLYDVREVPPTGPTEPIYAGAFNVITRGNV